MKVLRQRFWVDHAGLLDKRAYHDGARAVIRSPPSSNRNVQSARDGVRSSYRHGMMSGSGSGVARNSIADGTASAGRGASRHFTHAGLAGRSSVPCWPEVGSVIRFAAVQTQPTTLAL